MSGIFDSSVAAMIIDSIVVTLSWHDRNYELRRGSQNFDSIIVLPSHFGEKHYTGTET